MRRIMALAAVAGLCLAPFAFAADAEKPPEKAPASGELKTPAARISYALGLEIGGSLKRLKSDIDMVAFTRAIDDALKGAKPLLTADEADQVKEEFFTKFQERMAQEAKVAGEKNKTEGEAFLAKNKTEKGVVTTQSGLQYLVIKKGDGPMPKATDRVTVHYRGKLLDGTEFDSSYERKQPATFPVRGVIPGWTEALQLMNVGGSFRLFIPSNLAYGERGAGQQIGPNSTLIFEVELIKIEKPGTDEPEIEIER